MTNAAIGASETSTLVLVGATTSSPVYLWLNSSSSNNLGACWFNHSTNSWQGVALGTVSITSWTTAGTTTLPPITKFVDGTVYLPLLLSSSSTTHKAYRLCFVISNGTVQSVSM